MYAIPADYSPATAKKGDRLVEIVRQGEGWRVAFGFASADDSGRFEWRTARAATDRTFKSVAGAMRAAQAWISQDAKVS
jgi:hypothetical protein